MAHGPYDFMEHSSRATLITWSIEERRRGVVCLNVRDMAAGSGTFVGCELVWLCRGRGALAIIQILLNEDSEVLLLDSNTKGAEQRVNLVCNPLSF